jgi:hypothetical protein
VISLLTTQRIAIFDRSSHFAEKLRAVLIFIPLVRLRDNINIDSTLMKSDFSTYGCKTDGLSEYVFSDGLRLSEDED